MIDHISGKITFKNPTFIVVETCGVGYRISISLNAYARIEDLNDVKILTHLHVKEDSHTLFGFMDEAERNLFLNLISVSGIGPATALVVLSAMMPDEVRNAIITENVAAFKKVKGIGPKTAKRVILDLKDKMLKDSGELPVSLSVKDNTLRQEALSALMALGFSKIQVQKALNRVLKANPNIKNVEDLVREALKLVGK